MMECFSVGSDLSLAIRNGTIMQGERPSFVFDLKAATGGCERRKLRPDSCECRLAGAVADAVERSVGAAALYPVQSCCGAVPRLEEPVELGQQTAADQCNSALALS